MSDNRWEVRSSMALIRTILTQFVLTICFISEVTSAEAMLRRTTLLVQDAERSKAFYEAIGFREWLDWSEGQDPDALTGLPLNASPSHARVVIMAGQNPYIGMIGLLEYSEPPLNPSRPKTPSIGLMDIVLVVETNDLEEVKSNLDAMNINIIRAPKSYSSDGPAGQKTGLDMLVEDPDGYIVEISQVLNREYENTK